MPIQPQDEKLFIESVSPGSSELTVLANIDVEKFLDSLISEYSSMWTTQMDRSGVLASLHDYQVRTNRLLFCSAEPDCAELSEELLQYTYDIQNDITASAKSLYLRYSLTHRFARSGSLWIMLL